MSPQEFWRIFEVRRPVERVGDHPNAMLRSEFDALVDMLHDEAA
jgi:hypothetical protein